MIVTTRRFAAATAAILLGLTATHASAAGFFGTGDPQTAIPDGLQITFEAVPTGIYGELNSGGVTFRAQTLYFTVSPVTMGQAIDTTDALHIGFDEPVKSFAFNFGGNQDSIWELTAYDGADQMVDTFAIPTVGSGLSNTYIGISSDTPNIARAVLYNLSSGPDNVFVDNFTYLPLSAIPLPSTLPLMGGALAALGFVKRRKRDSRSRAVV